MRNLKLYNLSTPLDFGMYKGAKLFKVIVELPSYVRWCLMKVEWFVVDQEEIDEEFPKIKWSPTFREASESKWNNYLGYKFITSDLNDFDVVHYERDSYGEYVGTYAQDVEGLSDDFINDVLGGEADAYWNID